MVEIEFIEDGALVLIRFTKGVIVLTRADFVASLKRGKRYQRRTAMDTRLTAAHGGEPHA